MYRYGDRMLFVIERVYLALLQYTVVGRGRADEMPGSDEEAAEEIGAGTRSAEQASHSAVKQYIQRYP
jgi:hypothetical protein